MFRLKIARLTQILLVPGLIFFSRCEEDTSNLGSDLLPSSDNFDLRVDSTITIHTRTERTDSILSNNTYNALLGSFKDSVFGRSTAHFLAYFRPSVDFPVEDNYQVESVELILKYNNHFGATNSPLRLSVYQMGLSPISEKNGLKVNADYYSNTHLNEYFDDSIQIADYNFNPSADLIATDSLLHIPLSASFGTQVLALTDTIFNTDSLFFKKAGPLYIRADKSMQDGSILYFSVLDDDTKVNLRYTILNDTIDSVYSYDFYIDEYCANLNLFEFDYTDALFKDELNNESFSQDSLIFIQGMGGIRTYIEFEGLDSFKDSSIAISNASLMIPVDTNYWTARNFGLPDRLWLRSVLSDGTQDLYDAEHLYLGFDKAGGTYDTEEGAYTLNIPLQIQRIVNGEIDNHGFYMFSAIQRTEENIQYMIPDRISAKHAILKGVGSRKPIKLKLVYLVI